MAERPDIASDFFAPSITAEAINAHYGPTFGAYAETICKALAQLRESSS